MRAYEFIEIISENEQKVRNVLKQNNLLKPAQKQNLLKVYKSLTTNESLSLQELQIYEFVDDSNRETIKRVFMGVMGLISTANALAAGSGDTFADVDGDGDVDLDDQNDITPEQVDKLEAQFSEVAQHLKSPDFQKLQIPEKQALLDAYQEIEDRVGEVIKLHSMAQKERGEDDAAKKALDDFFNNKEIHDTEELKMKIFKGEAVAFNKASVEKAIASGNHDASSFRMWTADGDFRVYKDSEGKLTVGVGHLITNNSPADVKDLELGDSISYERGMELFDADVQEKMGHVNYWISKYPGLKFVDYEALVDMQFQMGSKIYNWNNFKTALANYDFETAAKELITASDGVSPSKWMEQTPKRAQAAYDAFMDAAKEVNNMYDDYVARGSNSGDMSQEQFAQALILQQQGKGPFS